MEIWGTGKPMREFMFSEDMAAACIFMMENVGIQQINSHTPDSIKSKDPRKIHFANIGTGIEISIKNLALKIKEALNFKGDIYFNDDKPDGTIRKLTNADMLHGLGFMHSIDLDQGIDLMHNAYLSNQDKQ